MPKYLPAKFDLPQQAWFMLCSFCIWQTPLCCAPQMQLSEYNMLLWLDVDRGAHCRVHLRALSSTDDTDWTGWTKQHWEHS